MVKPAVITTLTVAPRRAACAVAASASKALRWARSPLAAQAAPRSTPACTADIVAPISADNTAVAE
jgi:hypothetical protein